MRLRNKIAVGMLVLPATLAVSAGPALGAAAIDYTEIPLTEVELDANWVTDRAVPSGGYESVTFDGRSDVLEVRVDSTNRSEEGSFRYTEGLLRQVDAKDAVKIDLFVDPDWLTKDVRAGFWGADHDDAGARTDYFPIIEFTTAGEGDFTGWRVWDGVAGTWQNLPGVDFTPGQWATLEIFFNESEGRFDLSIGGTYATSTPAAGTTTNVGEVIVNSYNYGPGSDGYDVHWSSFATGDVMEAPGSKDDCKDDGFAGFGFDNQGQCIASVQSNGSAGH